RRGGVPRGPVLLPRPGPRSAVPGRVRPRLRRRSRIDRRAAARPAARAGGIAMKFYQVGSLAVGNRLLPEDQRAAQSDPKRANSLISGHRACQGCGEVLGARYVLDAAMRVSDGKLVVVNATGCLEVVSTPFPESAWRVPWLHSLFGNARRSPGRAWRRPRDSRWR